MRTFRFAVTMSVLTLVVSSCLNIEDVSEPTYVPSMGTVVQYGLSTKILLDDSIFVTPIHELYGDSMVVGERYFMFYALADTTNHPVGTYPILLDYAHKAEILQTKTLEPDSLDVWLNKPLHNVSLAWFSGTYLNLVFTSYLGSEPKSFELIRMKTLEQNDSSDLTPTLYYELRYNVESVSSGSSENFVSYDISSLTNEFQEAIKFNVNIRWNKQTVGSQYIEIEYTPGSSYFYQTLSAVNNRFIKP